MRTLALLSLLLAAPWAHAADPATITLTPTPLFPGDTTISPLQYGQFVEYLCDLVPSLWAEKLYDNSFEGLSPYKFVYLKETDFREHPWHPAGATNRAAFTSDKETRVSGDVSQRVTITGSADTPATVAVAQDELSVRKDDPLTFTIHLRSRSVDAVRLAIRQDGKTLAAATLKPAQDWQKFTAHLTPADAADHATLSLSFTGLPGATLWLDNASLMPDHTIAGGWRPDVVAALRDLRPGLIRFGGSALDDPNLGDFHWRDTVGPADARKPFRAWGGLQNPAAGLPEFVDLCRAAGAEPLLCVRFRGTTPEDAADEVEYFNGPVTTPMGSLRARHGHPEPYRVRYWQVGNEISSPDYESRLAAFCKAMKSADPAIELFSSFPTPRLLELAGDQLDYVCPHHYTPDLAACERDLDNLAAMIRAHSPNKRLKVAVTEWNTTAGDAGPDRAKLWSLDNALACARYHNLLHRHADLVAAANRSNLANSFCSGILQTDRRGRLYKTPTYYAQRLYATLAGPIPLKVGGAPPSLDLSATLSADRRTLTLFAINQTTRDVPAALDATAFPSSALTTHTLADRDRAGQPDVANSFDDPARVAVTTATGGPPAPTIPYRFPALSLTVLQWTAAAP